MRWFESETVVVPVDFSDLSHEALNTAAHLVRAAQQVQVVHVLPPLDPTDPGVIWGEVNDQHRIEHAEKGLRERLPETLRGAAVHVVIGDPGHEIARLAHEASAAVIIIPSHGRTGARRLLLGSVAERVVRLASCPVLVLK